MSLRSALGCPCPQVCRYTGPVTPGLSLSLGVSQPRGPRDTLPVPRGCRVPKAPGASVSILQGVSLSPSSQGCPIFRIPGTSSLSPMGCPCHLQGIPSCPPIPRCLIPVVPGDIVPVSLGVVPVASGAALFTSPPGYCPCSPSSAPPPPALPYSPPECPCPPGVSHTQGLRDVVPIPPPRAVVEHAGLSPSPQGCPCSHGGSYLPSKISAPPPAHSDHRARSGGGARTGRGHPRGRNPVLMGVVKGGAPACGARPHARPHRPANVTSASALSEVPPLSPPWPQGYCE